MRGFPLLNLLLALLIGGAVVLPLVYRATTVTARAVSPPPAMAPSAMPVTEAHVSLRFDHAPRTVRLKDGDTVLHEWASPGSALLLEENVRLPLSEGRVEFTVQIEWPEGTAVAMAQVSVEPDGLPARQEIVWIRNGRADQLLTLTWP